METWNSDSSSYPSGGYSPRGAPMASQGVRSIICLGVGGFEKGWRTSGMTVISGGQKKKSEEDWIAHGHRRWPDEGVKGRLDCMPHQPIPSSKNERGCWRGKKCFLLGEHPTCMPPHPVPPLRAGIGEGESNISPSKREGAPEARPALLRWWQPRVPFWFAFTMHLGGIGFHVRRMTLSVIATIFSGLKLWLDPQLSWHLLNRCHSGSPSQHTSSVGRTSREVDDPRCDCRIPWLS